MRLLSGRLGIKTPQHVEECPAARAPVIAIELEVLKEDQQPQYVAVACFAHARHLGFAFAKCRDAILHCVVETGSQAILRTSAEVECRWGMSSGVWQS